MRARLTRFPVELGNGAVDRQYFQPDDQLERYRQAKRAPSRPGRPRPCDRWTMHDDTEARRAALDAVRDWIVATLDREAPTLGRDLPGPRREFWDALGQTVQCDLVVMHRTAASDAAILMHVSFPSRWRPEAVSGTSFRTIHGPVPGFSEQPAQARSMVATMIERGPYLRFAWSLVADERLDHHPDDSEYTPWTADTPGWLRVERQLTVPFPAAQASLFLIRTYLYPFAELSAHQRGTLHQALDRMPAEVAEYKGVTPHVAEIRAAIDRAGPVAVPDEV